MGSNFKYLAIEHEPETAPNMFARNRSIMSMIIAYRYLSNMLIYMEVMKGYDART